MKKSNNEFKPYFSGIDIGTDSVGYAVTNTDYTLCKFRGEPMWGETFLTLPSNAVKEEHSEVQEDGLPEDVRE